MPAGRPKGSTQGPLTEAHRDKIRKSNILSALIAHAEGTRDMTATQVTAGLGLLKKCLPDLQSVEMTGQDGGPIEVVNVIKFTAPGMDDAGSKD